MARDIVCGMEVEEDKAAASSEYKGKEYYFCSEYCKKEFDQNPEKYISASERPAESPGPGKIGKDSNEKTGSPSQERIDLPIMGMSCASCAANIQKNLALLLAWRKPASILPHRGPRSCSTPSSSSLRTSSPRSGK
jgi:Cu+-exporting ATPase